MNIWFSSDWHISHANIAGLNTSKWKSGYRDFENVHEMNKCITQNLNKYVKYDDVLYFLGDFCFGGHQKTPDYRAQINCQNIHVCRGNHDNHIDLYKDSFSSMQDVLTVKHGKHTFFLSHYAHRVWYGSHKGVIHLYGHSHDSLDKNNQLWGKSMDCGIDSAYRILGEYRPFSVEEIISIMDKREVKFVDNHDKNTNI